MDGLVCAVCTHMYLCQVGTCIHEVSRWPTPQLPVSGNYSSLLTLEVVRDYYLFSRCREKHLCCPRPLALISPPPTSSRQGACRKQCMNGRTSGTLRHYDPTAESLFEGSWHPYENHALQLTICPVREGLLPKTCEADTSRTTDTHLSGHPVTGPFTTPHSLLKPKRPERE